MEALNTTRQILCPSNECKEGAILLGIVQKDGRVGFLNQKVHINNEFVQIAHTGRSPEKRFRFASKCLNDDCENWTNGGCGVIQAVIDSIGPICEPSVLPDCSIRPDCRWYQQCGGRACAVCPQIITDLAPE